MHQIGLLVATRTRKTGVCGIRLAFQDWNHVIGLAVGTGLTVKSAERVTVWLVSWSRAKISRV